MKTHKKQLHLTFLFTFLAAIFLTYFLHVEIHIQNNGLTVVPVLYETLVELAKK